MSTPLPKFQHPKIPVGVQELDFATRCDGCGATEGVLLIEARASWKSMHLCPACRGILKHELAKR